MSRRGSSLSSPARKPRDVLHDLEEAASTQQRRRKVARFYAPAQSPAGLIDPCQLSRPIDRRGDNSCKRRLHLLLTKVLTRDADLSSWVF